MKKLIILTTVFMLACLIYIYQRPNAAADNSQLPTYVVQPGDTLWQIAREYQPPRTDIRVFIDRIIKVNKLPGPTIYPGQALYIPSK